MLHSFPKGFLVLPAIAGMLSTIVPQGTEAAVFRPVFQQGHVNYRAATAMAKVSCASLAGRVLDSESTITSATDIGASGGVPEHCEAVVHTKYTLHIAIDMPTAWNQRGYVLGNGGFGTGSELSAGAIAERDAVLVNNFAVASNDDGESNASLSTPTYGSFLQTNPEGLVDYSYRAVHYSAVYVKEVSNLYYGQRPAETYFNGCSDGGREGLIEAQRFPADFDGIVAGAAVLADSDLQIQNAWNVRAYNDAPFTLDQLATVTAAVLAKCGEKLNGAADGIVPDPRLCHFDPATEIPVCSGAASASCLTAPQLAAYEKIIGGPISRGKIYFPGMPLGSEANWPGAIVPAAPGAISYQKLLGDNWIRYALGYGTGINFNPATFAYNSDPYLDNNLAPVHAIADSTNTNLSPFERRGGKMISYVGWADPLVGPWSLVGYYESVERTLGQQHTDSFYRFFTLPGVAHCAGGAGPDTIDPFDAMVDWKEAGFPPNTLIASKLNSEGQILFQRTLCMYPYMGRFINGDNPTSAASWECVPGPTGVPLTDYPKRNPFDSRYHEISP
jgi:feruloyl esterase